MLPFVANHGAVGPLPSSTRRLKTVSLALICFIVALLLVVVGGGGGGGSEGAPASTAAVVDKRKSAAAIAVPPTLPRRSADRRDLAVGTDGKEDKGNAATSAVIPPTTTSSSSAPTLGAPTTTDATTSAAASTTPASTEAPATTMTPTSASTTAITAVEESALDVAVPSTASSLSSAVTAATAGEGGGEGGVPDAANSSLANITAAPTVSSVGRAAADVAGAEPTNASAGTAPSLSSFAPLGTNSSSIHDAPQGALPSPTPDQPETAATAAVAPPSEAVEDLTARRVVHPYVRDERVKGAGVTYSPPSAAMGGAAGRGRAYQGPQGVPVGARHDAHTGNRRPAFAQSFVDEPTRLMEAMDPETPDPSTADKYDRPEDADELARNGSIWHELSTKYKNASPETLVDVHANGAMCLISVVYGNNCRYLDESLEECVLRVGPSKMETVLSEMCRLGRWWLQFSGDVMRRGIKKYPDGHMPLQMPPVPAAEICDFDRADVPYVDPEDRPQPPMGPPRHCRSGGLQYPISFGTPAVNFQNNSRLLPKLFDMSPIPLDASTGGAQKLFGVNDEDAYQAVLGMSRFCLTHSRGGWDCGRHYEIMGAGCIPYFYDIHAAGPYILPQFPKRFLMDVVEMPIFDHIGHVLGGDGDEFDLPENQYVNASKFLLRFRVLFRNEPFYLLPNATIDKAWYWEKARKLYKFTKKYLTSEAVVSYVLKTMGIENAKHILIITHSGWDNLQQTITTGLDGLGINMTVVTPHSRVLYGCFQEIRQQYALINRDVGSQRKTALRAAVHANAHPWGNRMRSRHLVFLNNFWESLANLESRSVYDAVFFTHYWPGDMPATDFFAAKYNVNGKVAVFDGNDSQEDPRAYANYMDKEAYFFSRELRYAGCY